MLRKVGLAVYRGFFWTYERGTWQYDIMVILILAFIFMTPRQFFQDRPIGIRVAPSDVVLLLNGDSQKIYQLRAALIDAQDAKTDSSLKQGIRRVLRSFTGKSVEITRIETNIDSTGRVVSYAVWVQE